MREAYAKIPGNKPYALRQIKLNTLISRLSSCYKFTKGKNGLSEEEEKWACKVKNIADSILHDRLIEAEEAFEVFEQVRLVILAIESRDSSKN